MLRSGLIATKIGNSSYYYDDGTNSHVTLLKVDECIVANVKTKEKIKKTKSVALELTGWSWSELANCPIPNKMK